jgi:hypothetical protein
MAGSDTFESGASGLPSRGMTVHVLLYPGDDGYLVAEWLSWSYLALDGTEYPVDHLRRT